jgi:2-C-methyl-D-erythritol 4-phosphate cytidylyltransferase
MLRGGASPRNKVLLPLRGEALLRSTARAFQGHPAIHSVRVIAHAEDLDELSRAFADSAAWSKLGPWIEGGAERQDSVRLGLQALASGPGPHPDWVLVHDGARPCCSAGLIQRVLEGLTHSKAVVPVLPVFDTVRSTTDAHQSNGVVDRAHLRMTQTPQGFHWNLLLAAHERAYRDGIRATDDAQLVESMGQPVALVPGERRNVKVTLSEDLALAEWIAGHPDWGTESAQA